MHISGILLFGLVYFLSIGFAPRAVADEVWVKIQDRSNCSVELGHKLEALTATWTGGCVDGKADGPGSLVWRYKANGEWNEEEFLGVLRQGRVNGFGIRRFANGNEFEGLIIGHQQQGNGVFRWANGDTYEGGFLDGKISGGGVFTFATGAKCKGEWRDNGLVGYGSGILDGQDCKCFLSDGGIRFSNCQ